MSFLNSIMIFITIILFSTQSDSIFNTHNHRTILFRSPDLFPASFTHDPTAKRFILTSSRRPSLISVSHSGTVKTLLSDHSLPNHSIFLDVTVDPFRQRILVTVHCRSDPPNAAVAAYQLRPPHHRLSLVPLHDMSASVDAPAATGVAIDFFGNAVVTNAASNFIWNVGLEGRHSVFSACPVYKTHKETRNGPNGLTGIAYNSKGFFLVVQANTGKLFRVFDKTGFAQEVELQANLTGTGAIDIKNDDTVVVMSKHKLYFLDSDDGWNKAVVIDKIALDKKRSPSSVTVGGDGVYVLYSHVEEGMTGNSHRDEFSIVEIGPKLQRDHTWIIYLLIWYCSVYFVKRRLKM